LSQPGTHLVAGPIFVQLLEEALEVEDLLALLSKRSRECYECACNTAIHKKTDLEEMNTNPRKELGNLESNYFDSRSKFVAIFDS